MQSQEYWIENLFAVLLLFLFPRLLYLKAEVLSKDAAMEWLYRYRLPSTEIQTFHSTAWAQQRFMRTGLF